MAYPLRLNSLGSLHLLGIPEAEGRRLVAQPKRCALLLYLALARPHGWHRRDTLLALLWPELDESHARNALSQSLHHLRRILGAEALEGVGTDALRLNPQVIVVDAADFEGCIADGRMAQAIRLYEGDLASGFHLADTPGFERWLDGERQRLRGLACHAAVAVADAAERAGDRTQAVGALQRVQRLRPEDEGILRRLMLLLESSGDRVAALHAYQQFSQWLRTELETEPSPETRALAARLRASDGTTAPSPPPAVPVPTSTDQRNAWRLARRLLVVVIPLLTLTAAWRLMAWHPMSSATAERESVLVVPFRVAEGDSALFFLRDGMVDLLGTKLTGASGPRALDARLALSAWQGARFGAEVMPQQIRDLARTVGARQAISGSVLRNGQSVILQATLMQAEATSGDVVAQVEGRLENLALLVDQLAAQLLLRQSGEPGPRLPALVDHPLPALIAYLEGRRAYRAGDYDQAARSFRTALDLDSTLTLAALYRADAIDWIGSDDAVQARADAWATSARLAPGDRAYLVALLGPRFPRKPTTAERITAWEHASAMTPDRAEVWFGLGDVLYHRGELAEIPRADERAHAAFQRALAADSGYAAPLTHLADMALAAHEVARAQELVVRYLRRDSLSGIAWYLRWRLAQEPGSGWPNIKLTDVPSDGLFRIATGSQLHGVAEADGRAAAQLLVERAITERELWSARRLRWLVAANTGHFAEFRRYLQEAAVDPANALELVQLFGDAGREWTVPPSGARELYARHFAALGRLWSGESLSSQEVTPLRHELETQPEPWTTEARIELEAMLECRTSPPAAHRALDRLDSLIASGPPEMDWGAYRPLLLARCYEWKHDPTAALRTIRRRPNEAWAGIPFLATFLKEEGQLALAVGDTSSARESWRRYLNLRATADSSLRDEVEAIRRRYLQLRAAAPAPRSGGRRMSNPG